MNINVISVDSPTITRPNRIRLISTIVY
jgi:hypothetical protein